jgi:hypothetical protein
MGEEPKKEAVTVQESGSPASEQTQVAESTHEPKPGSKEFNFRRLEEKSKETESRLREQEQLNQQLKEALTNLVNPSQSKAKEELPQLTDDDIPEWKHVKSYAEKIAEQKFQELSNKKERDLLPQKARAKFSDFDEIVNADSIKKLEQGHPELAMGIVNSPDPFSSSYKIIKQFYGVKKPNAEVKEELEKIDENANKPKAINTQGALKNANAFAKKSKDQLYKEMMSCANRV